MKSILLLLSFYTTAVFAQSSVTTVAPAAEDKDWSVEAQIYTISNSSSTTFGPALLFQWDEENYTGGRLTAPIGSPESGTISAQALYRHYFGQKKTNLFVEGTLGENWYYSGEPRTTLMSPSIGTNLGVIHHLTSDISFGGVAGMEWTQTSISRGVASNDGNSVYIWGRIGIFGSLVF